MTPQEFLAKHGFPGTPAGDRMRADLEELIEAERDDAFALADREVD